MTYFLDLQHKSVDVRRSQSAGKPSNHAAQISVLSVRFGLEALGLALEAELEQKPFARTIFLAA